jgi:hypothetical protein
MSGFLGLPIDGEIGGEADHSIELYDGKLQVAWRCIPIVHHGYFQSLSLIMREKRDKF